MSENGNQFFEDTIAHLAEKNCLIWLNLLKHNCFFRIFRKTGNVLEIYWRIFILSIIDEVCLVWLETVPAECIDLLDPSFFQTIYF